MPSEKEIAKLYKKKQIESATPVHLILLLYEGAIDYLTKAEEFLGEKGFDRYEKFHNNLIACQNIVTELTVSLDLERGGEVAKNLLRLYDYINNRLVDANLSKDMTILHEVKELLSTLYQAWKEVKKKEHSLDIKEKPRQGLNIQG